MRCEMLSKELEILKQIEELYHGDISEEDFINECLGKEKKIEAWREAFAEYPLYEVSKAINHFYVKKSSKTRPNIAQLTAILQENNAVRETSYQRETFDLGFGLKFQQMDKENGDMHWFVPDYQKVENLISMDYWGWVSNIKNPSYDDFHRCMEEWCLETTGHKYRFYSDNDIANMTEEQKQALWDKCHEKINSFKVKTLN